ncbi:PP2C family protein-serine/threonine phosphatase [Actinacidiphila bryophytorum]|uniref:Serine phosphatase RsbU, regulator of sigma subunit n=2 Tax=Actinacidiphila bryophytorum TaxID=1436133 RepID=A0A9W4H4Y4_9ACTN|nr:PP2C family protein-serine/threonine phosphatase [Actinacidiphila bryophytorum]MBM9437201.1 serine/threonine-protein phosphatase [Actinacidiphila bryophytorum]CAG7651037.1 Serine phosphatase RsbU, regulator of sigma subunit [Actinacidiphila bryophytorum]
MNPAHVRKVAGSEPPRSAAAHTPAAPVATAPSAAALAATPTPAVPPAPVAVSAPALPDRGSPEHSLAVQDRLASWVCDLSLLHELTERLARTASLDATLREVLQAGATLVGARRGLIALAPADGRGPDTTVGLGLGHADLGALETVDFGRGPVDADEAVGADLRQGEHPDARTREVAAQLGLGAAYGLALTANGTGFSPRTADSSTSGAGSSTGASRLGSAVWFYDEAAEPTDRQRRLTGLYLRFAGEHIARALELARVRRASAELAAETLPARLPRVPGVRMAVRHGTGPLGGGDWYDALPLPEGALGLAVGGVTGAGPGAVAAMGRLRASLRAYAVMEGEDPVAVLSDLELLLRLTEPARSATALFGHVGAPLTRGGRKVTLAGAGHCPPLLVGDQRCEYVETSLSAPLNMLSCWEAPSVELHVRAGESLVLFTDGLLHRTGESSDRAFAHVHAAAQSASRAVREDPGLLADHLLHTVLPDGLDATGGEEDLVLLVARFD